MSCYFTLRGLWLLHHSDGAPLWRTVVTLENSTLINVLSALIVAVVVGYVVRCVSLYYFIDREDIRCSGLRHVGVIFPCLAALAFLVSPALLKHVCWLSPFLFSLVFPALSLALLISLVESPFALIEDNDEYITETRKFLTLRLFLSGLFAAMGAWESTLGEIFVLIAFVMTLLWPIRLDNSVARITGVWLVGFIVGLVAEIYYLPACSWVSLAPAIPPVAWAVAFFITGLLPIPLFLRFGVRTGLVVAWGIMLLICGIWVAHGTATAKASASETFVRRCLADIGSRKLIVSDGFFDDAFRVLAPPDVRVMGTRTVADREYLIKCFSEGAALTNRALIVTHCYSFPEFPEAACEAGLFFESKATAKKPKTAASEAERVEKILKPVRESINTMENDFASIPVEQRKLEIEKARTILRTSWDKGAYGYQISSMLLALDMLQGDRHGLESDALTALMIDIDDPSANAVLGELRLMDGRIDDAERYLKKAIRGEGTMAMCDYARLLVVQGKHEEAMNWARKAIEKRPNDPVMREPLITALVESHQFEAASREINVMLDLVKDDVRRSAQCRAFAAHVDKRIQKLKK